MRREKATSWTPPRCFFERKRISFVLALESFESMNPNEANRVFIGPARTSYAVAVFTWNRSIQTHESLLSWLPLFQTVIALVLKMPATQAHSNPAFITNEAPASHMVRHSANDNSLAVLVRSIWVCSVYTLRALAYMIPQRDRTWAH